MYRELTGQGVRDVRRLALRQPLVVSFIAAGIVAGPSVLGVARSQEATELLADLGVP